MENQVKKREWVKTAAIIFLALLLVLTFFSNTILNASLTSVSAKQVGPGSIKARITGSGTVSANESYDVTINQSRKVASIKVKVGKEVSAGDVMFVLEAEDSEELKTAQQELAAMELAYNKALIEAGNSAAKDDHEVEKAQKAYDEAVRIYNQYATVDPTYLATAKVQAEKRLKDLQRASDNAQEAYTEAQADEDYAAAKQELETLKTKVDELAAKIEELKKKLSGGGDYSKEILELEEKIREIKKENIAEKEAAVENRKRELKEAQEASDYILLIENICGGDLLEAETIASHDSLTTLKVRIVEAELAFGSAVDSLAERIHDAWTNLKLAEAALELAQQELADARKLVEELPALEARLEALKSGQKEYESEEEIRRELKKLQDEYNVTRSEMDRIERMVSSFESRLEQLKLASKAAKQAVEDQKEVVDDLSSAESAAATVKSAKQALEDLLFNKSLGNSGYLDTQDQKKKIEEKEAEIEKLMENADEVEVLAKVSGVVSAINVTAGKTVGAEETMATINLTDRGYTVKIPVTAEQSKRVSVGDTATISNLWNSDITATLESIAPDPNSTSSGKLLIFRLTGDVTPDQNLTLSIGQKSQNFDVLVPNAAVRDDANGKYVLVLTIKKTPLNDRYVARRVDVQVLGSDDNSSAVSGLTNGDFVITSSAKPVAAGDEVRLAESAG